MLELLIAFIFIVIVIVAMTGKGRVFLKGFLNKFFEDAAATPDGADAIYADAIEKAEKDYLKASNNLRSITGIVSTTEIELSKSRNNVKDIKHKCESLAKAKKYDDLEIMAIELSAEEENIEVLDSRLKEYLPMQKDAETVCSAIEKKLMKLKTERKVVVKQLTLNKQSAEIYDSLDDLRKATASDKLVSQVKEGAINSKERAVGAKAVYENKNSTKLDRINKDIKGAATSSYIEELKNKYK